MPTQVRLFISAGPELEPARELLGQGLAAFPVNVGWVIKRTPDIDSVAECHLFVVLLGADITAPVGLELWWARRTEKPIFAYRLEGARTPAGQVFLQDNADLDWRRFGDPVILQRMVLTDLSRFLLSHTDRYGVTLFETERLRLYIAELEKAVSASKARPVPEVQSRAVQDVVEGKITGAGGGGVILAPGKDQPVGARVVGEE
jgi:hypothetical protein